MRTVGATNRQFHEINTASASYAIVPPPHKEKLSGYEMAYLGAGERNFVP